MLPDRRNNPEQLGNDDIGESVSEVRGVQKKKRGNPYGNRKRCRDCNALAAKDGWCKNHRPVKRVNPFRDNFKPAPSYFDQREDFGAVKNGFSEEDKWG